MRRLLTFLFIVTTLTRCATSGSGESEITSGPVELVIFSAPWCENCEPFIKEMKNEIDRLSSVQQEYIRPQIRVVTGKNKPQKPTDEIAAEYAAKLGVGFPAVADFWKTGLYATYYGKESPAIPAAVILLADGQAKIQKPGASAAEVMAVLEGVLQ